MNVMLGRMGEDALPLIHQNRLLICGPDPGKSDGGSCFLALVPLPHSSSPPPHPTPPLTQTRSVWPTALKSRQLLHRRAVTSTSWCPLWAFLHSPLQGKSWWQNRTKQWSNFSRSQLEPPAMWICLQCWGTVQSPSAPGFINQCPASPSARATLPIAFCGLT